MKIQITKSSQTEWKPLIEEGVKTKGLYVKTLRFDEAANRPPTFLLKFEPGAAYSRHFHPAGEEVFVLEGKIQFDDDHLQPGDYLYTPPGSVHAVYSKEGCVVLFVVPEEVQIL
ncbi:cupin domain-containing protein [Flavobacterium sp.]|uniref:cupin domain-containing protein n=1 Tax=Flavobacterium sp. TaxID=239 RepID=UPI003D6A7A79